MEPYNELRLFTRREHLQLDFDRFRDDTVFKKCELMWEVWPSATHRISFRYANPSKPMEIEMQIMGMQANRIWIDADFTWKTIDWCRTRLRGEKDVDNDVRMFYRTIH